MKFNLKGWQKTKAEKDHTILKNKDGHELKIAHKMLSKMMKDQLDGLPHYSEGTPNVQPSPEPKKYNPQAGDPEYSGVPNKTDPDKRAQAAKSMSNAFADGGPIEPNGQDTSGDSKTPVIVNVNGGQQPQQQDQGFAHAIGQHIGNAIKQGIADTGGAVRGVAQPFMNAASGLKDALLPEQDAQEVTSQTPASIPVDPQLQQAQQNLSIAQQAPDTATPLSDDSTSNQNLQQMPDPNAGFGMANKAANIGAESETALAKEQQNLLAHQYENERSFNAATQEHLHDIMGESDALMEDIRNQHIDPNRFLGKMDTAQRFATGIGLILGGIGGGILHQGNPALDFLNRQIDRDIESQRANLGKTQSLLSANMQKYHNYQDAANITRVQMAHMFTNQLDQAASKQGGALAQQRALNLKQEAVQKYYPLAMQTAMRQALMSVNSQNPGSQVSNQVSMVEQLNPEQGKLLRERLIPGGGVNGEDVLAKKPINDSVMSNLNDRENLIKASNKLLSDIKANTIGGKLDPTKRAALETQAIELQGLYRKGIGASTSEGEKKDIGEIIGANPSSLVADLTYAPKLKALSDSQNTSLNTIRKTYGLPEKQIKETMSDNTRLQPQVKIVNGIKYMRGPQGQAIKVQ